VRYATAIDNQAYRPEIVSGGNPPDSAIGNFEHGFANALVKIDVTYENGYQHHNPMEPHAALAQWDGDRLTAYVSQQSLSSARAALAATLRIPRENVRLISRYIGGGFGSKLPANPEVVLASLATHVLRRPVKVVLTGRKCSPTPAIVRRSASTSGLARIATAA
jgi:xanthine dehydrogenase YagR molybdenum-binding subunit